MVDKDAEGVLPFHFTDRNWITYEEALRAENNPLNKWKGKQIMRIRPAHPISDYFMSDSPYPAPTLISASKYHMVIMHNDSVDKGETTVLCSAYTNPDDWVLAE